MKSLFSIKKFLLFIVMGTILMFTILALCSTKESYACDDLEANNVSSDTKLNGVLGWTWPWEDITDDCNQVSKDSYVVVRNFTTDENLYEPKEYKDKDISWQSYKDPNYGDKYKYSDSVDVIFNKFMKSGYYINLGDLRLIDHDRVDNNDSLHQKWKNVELSYEDDEIGLQADNPDGTNDGLLAVFYFSDGTSEPITINYRDCWTVDIDNSSKEIERIRICCWDFHSSSKKGVANISYNKQLSIDKIYSDNSIIFSDENTSRKDNPETCMMYFNDGLENNVNYQFYIKSLTLHDYDTEHLIGHDDTSEQTWQDIFITFIGKEVYISGKCTQENSGLNLKLWHDNSNLKNAYNDEINGDSGVISGEYTGNKTDIFCFSLECNNGTHKFKNEATLRSISKKYVNNIPRIIENAVNNNDRGFEDADINKGIKKVINLCNQSYYLTSMVCPEYVQLYIDQVKGPLDFVSQENTPYFKINEEYLNTLLYRDRWYKYDSEKVVKISCKNDGAWISKDEFIDEMYWNPITKKLYADNECNNELILNNFNLAEDKSNVFVAVENTSAQIGIYCKDQHQNDNID